MPNPTERAELSFSLVFGSFARSRFARGLLTGSFAVACAPIALAGPSCAEAGARVALPAVLGETSGIAVASAQLDVLWTHNDGDSDLYAVAPDGRVLAQFPISTRLRDVEDVAVGACGVGTCVYLADVGDNLERRPAGNIRLARVVEPDLGDPGPLEAEVFPMRLPDGPRDIEALFVLPDERPYLVTKGRSSAVTVYRYPVPLRPDTVTLEAVQVLAPRPDFLLDEVTGADASPDGRTVGVRTYQSLRFFRVEADTLASMSDGLVNLRTLGEMQGEGLGLGQDGRVVLTSESGPLGGAPTMHVLRCDLEPR